MATSSAPTRTWHRRGAVAVLAAIAAMTVAFVAAPDDGHGRATPAASASPSPTVPEGAFTLAVDDTLEPARATIEGLDPGDAPREVGRLLDADGTATDLVLDELVVTSASPDQLAAFLDRWDAEVVHSYPPEPDGSQDHLVRLDAARIGAEADAADVAADLLSMEPYHAGEMRLGDPAVLGVLAVTAYETVHGGPVVSPNFVPDDAGIEERSMEEHHDQDDAWAWSYLTDGGAQDFGVTGAWELLHHAGRMERYVNVMIFDGGFYENPDFPLDPTIRGAAWGDRNPATCTNGAACPWHGTDVAITAVGQGDNQWGSVGPGGPIGRLIAVERHGDIYAQLRDLVEMVDIEFATIVNLSYSFRTTVAQAGHRYSFDRRLTKIDDRALIVAAAGNYGENVDAESCSAVDCWENKLTMPCESSHVLCVGGLSQGSTQRADGSNYGTDDDDESVELYGPMRVIVPGTDDEGFLDGTTQWTSGTSVAAPFVAGIAALMESATEYQITPGELHDLLLRTANVGGLGDEVTGSRRRVNARAAAAELLGIATVAPEVRITSHETGDEILADDFLALFGEATDFLGRDLAITWRSEQQGDLGTTAPGDNLGPDLRVGTHELVATATDFLGQSTEARIALTVVDNPPVLAIGAPIDGADYFTGQHVPLLGTAQDQDTWTDLDDDEVAWTVIRRSTGTVVASDSGLSGVFEATSPGTYDIVFSTVGGDHHVETTVSITVRNPPPGTPVVTIQAPEPDTSVGGGAFELRGSATVDGAPLSGTRLRWVAIAGDTVVELCRGSSFDVIAGEDLGLTTGEITSCSVSEAELFLVNNGDTLGSTVWTLRLEARGTAVEVGSAEVAVTYVHSEQ